MTPFGRNFNDAKNDYTNTFASKHRNLWLKSRQIIYIEMLHVCRLLDFSHEVKLLGISIVQRKILHIDVTERELESNSLLYFTRQVHNSDFTCLIVASLNRQVVRHG